MRLNCGLEDHFGDITEMVEIEGIDLHEFLG